MRWDSGYRWKNIVKEIKRGGNSLSMSLSYLLSFLFFQLSSLNHISSPFEWEINKREMQNKYSFSKLSLSFHLFSLPLFLILSKVDSLSYPPFIYSLFYSYHLFYRGLSFSYLAPLSQLSPLLQIIR